MSCNCNNNNSLCSGCSKGQLCSCPPDYSILPLVVPCDCCPPGYYDLGNGYCCADGAQCKPNSPTNTPIIPCTTCEDSVPSDCVFLPAIPCWGVTAGTTLTSFIRDFMCSEAFILKQLQTIGLSVNLKAAFCQIVSVCPLTGSTVPIPGPIIVTVP